MQLAPSLYTLRSYRYALYIDGARQVLASPRCDDAPTGTQQYGCTAPLPALALGRHVLELSTSVFSVADGTLLESPRSDPLVIEMVGGGGALQLIGSAVADELRGPRRGLGLAPPEPSVRTSDDVDLSVEILATGLIGPRALDAAPDGRLFLVEERGVVWIVQDGRRLAEAALSLATDDLDALAACGLAVDPNFTRNHYVYLSYLALARAGPVLRVARYRELAGVLAQPAVIIDGIDGLPVRSSARCVGGRLRFAGDGTLVLGVPAVRPPGAPGQRAVDGQLQRFISDGRVAWDAERPSGVLSMSHVAPEGFDWDPLSGDLWVADRLAEDRSVIALASRPGSPRRAEQPPLTIHGNVTGMRFYSGTLFPAFANDLFAAVGNRLLRIRLKGAGGSGAPVDELRLQVGDIADIAVGRDGAIYFLALRPRSQEQGGDGLLGRLVPLH